MHAIILSERAEIKNMFAILLMNFSNLRCMTGLAFKLKADKNLKLLRKLTPWKNSEEMKLLSVKFKILNKVGNNRLKNCR